MHYDGCTHAGDSMVIERCADATHGICSKLKQAGKAQHFSASDRCLWCREKKSGKKAGKEAKREARK